MHKTRDMISVGSSPEDQGGISAEYIRRALGERSPEVLPSVSGRRDAAVAMIFRQNSAPAHAGLELLLMQRAHHPQDPWSGNLSFPGGKIDPEDHSAFAAAVRETREEMALELCSQHCLGRLDDIYASLVRVKVSAYVFCLEGQPNTITPNHEVQRHFWVPVSHFFQPEHHALRSIDWHGSSTDVPSFFIHSSVPPLWGLTYRLLMQLLKHCGVSIVGT